MSLEWISCIQLWFCGCSRHPQKWLFFQQTLQIFWQLFAAIYYLCFNHTWTETAIEVYFVPMLTGKEHRNFVSTISWALVISITARLYVFIITPTVHLLLRLFFAVSIHMIKFYFQAWLSSVFLWDFLCSAMFLWHWLWTVYVRRNTLNSTLKNSKFIETSKAE